MTDSADWTWELRDRARDAFLDLDAHHRDRIRSKLNEIVDDEWREPDEYLEPLTGVPHAKLRVGGFRLGCECDYGEHVLKVYTIERRPGAYEPGDD